MRTDNGTPELHLPQISKVKFIQNEFAKQNHFAKCMT